MDTMKRNGILLLASLGMAIAACVLSIIAIATRPPRDGTSNGASVSPKLGEPRTEALSQLIAPLSGRLEELEAKVDKAISGADEALMRKIAFDTVRETWLHNEGQIHMRVDQLPPEIQETARKTVPGIELHEVEMRRTRRGTFYRIDGEVNGEDFGMRIAQDSTVLEADLPLYLAPDNIVTALAKAVPGSQLQWIVKKHRDGEHVFDVEAALDDDEYELRFGSDGRLIEGELPLSAVPAPALEAAKKAAPGVSFNQLTVEEDEGQLMYYIEGRLERDWFAVTVTGEGEVQWTEMPTSRVPEGVRNAAAKAVPNARLGKWASKWSEEGRTLYEIEARRGRHGEGTTIHLTEAGEVVKAEKHAPGDWGPDGEGGRADGDAPRPAEVRKEDF